VLVNWENRSAIIANLFNPAFCGEIIRRTVSQYNLGGEEFPFLLTYLILPIVLHKQTRSAMPNSTATYFHSWVEENEHLFVNFSERVKEMNPFTKESAMFLLNQNSIKITDSGNLTIVQPYRKKLLTGDGIEEVKEIFRKAELLGRWFRLTGNVQTIYMFLKIRP
jgi:hypothetical protein